MKSSPLTHASLDDLDFAILEQLQDDGRRSFREISKRLGVTPATVRSRVNALGESGVVEIVAVPDPIKLGMGYFAVIALNTAPEQAEEIAAILAARDDTSYVGLAVTGCEVLVEVALQDVQEFLAYRRDVLAPLPGLQGIRVFLISDVKKVRYRLAHSPTSAATS